MDLHVLNGDSLAEKFDLSQNFIVCREALIDGPVADDNLPQFWNRRAQYIEQTYNSKASEYNSLVVSQYHILARANVDEITLWFEHDLFCQVNLWFTIAFIKTHKEVCNIYLASPASSDQSWNGFGSLRTNDLVELFKNRQHLAEKDIQLAKALWDAYRNQDLLTLSSLAKQTSNCFPKLKQVCEAELDRHSEPGRPQRILRNIINSGIDNFEEIFSEFQKTEKIYGFGDMQVKRMLERMK